MRRIARAALVVLSAAAPALAGEMPSRKAGLWEVTTSLSSRGGAGMAIQQCIDAATDQMMMSSAGPMAAAACSRRDIQHSGDTTTIDSTCTLKDKTATTHAVIKGSFDSAYTMTVSFQSEAMPGGPKTMTMAAKYLGPCAAGQKPGDMIMPGGIRLNIVEMQKRGLSQGAPLPR